MAHYEADNIRKIRYEAEKGKCLRAVVEATNAQGGANAVFEVNLGMIQKLRVDGVELATRRRGRFKNVSHVVVTWDDIRSGDVLSECLNGQRGSIRRVGVF